MKRIRTSHLIVAGVVVLMLAAAGTAYSSNMAFKINTTIQGQPSCATCDNWISLPFNNPFTTPRPTTICPSTAPACLRAICDSNGDGAVGGADTIQNVSQQSATNVDTLITHSCTGLVGITNPAYQPTRAVRIRSKTVSGTIPTNQVIFVGSDAPGTQINVHQIGTVGECATCDNWVDLVYHTTYTNMRSACDSNNNGVGGGTTVDSTDGIQNVSQQSAANVDTLITHSCTGLAGINNPAIQIGRGMRLRLKTPAAGGPAGDLLISEPHF